MRTELQLQVASTFTCTPLEPPLVRALEDAGITGGVEGFQFAQMSEYMLSANSKNGILGIVVLLRLEDWLREQLKSADYAPARDAWVRQEFRPRVEEFVSQFAILSRLGRQLWLLPCPSIGWISEQHKLAGLCRTFTNLVMARVRGLPGVTLLTWPAALPENLVDREADRLHQTPYTAEGFRQLGEWLGDQIARTLSREEPAVADSCRSPELAAYLAALQVRVELKSAGPEDRTHVDHMLRSIASFSLTGEQPTITESEVDARLGAADWILISVADRIQNYGASGLVAFRVVEGAMVIDSMAISCTVLGKQVEYAVVSDLARIAAARQCGTLVFEYRPSGRNQPMQAFLQQIAGQESAGRFVLAAGEVESRIATIATNPGAWSLQRL
jgi:hypothetical protein